MENKTGTEVKNGTKVRNVFFTECNYTNRTFETLKDLIETTAEKGGFGIVGEETAPTTGTPHYHAYLEFPNPVSLTKLNKTFPKAHFEKRKGTSKQARDYCAKDGAFFEKGEISNQGGRSDIKEACEAVIEGKSFKDIALEHPEAFTKYEKGLRALKASQYTHRTERPIVSWHWGQSGTGKTETAVRNHKTHYVKDCSIWWDRYEQEEAIIIDDFDGKWNFRDFLRLLDKNKYQGQYKGGYIPINSKYIYITCEYPPSEFWQGNELEQVMSRLSKVIHFEGENLRKAETKTEFLTYTAKDGFRNRSCGTEVGVIVSPNPSVPKNIFELDWKSFLGNNNSSP